MDDEQLVTVLTKDALTRCIKKWGLEGTIEKIHELCYVESMKEVMLNNFYEMTKLPRKDI